MFERIKDFLNDYRYDREQKKLEKEKDKNDIRLLSNAKQWFILRWEEFARGILSGKYSEQDINIYIRNEDRIDYSITRVKSKVEEKRKREIYNAVLNNDKPLKKRLLEEIKTEILVHKEELNRTKLWDALDNSEIIQKNKKIKRLEDSIAKAEVIIEKLMQENENTSAEPKKRGRPTKEELAKKKVTAFMEDIEEG